MQNYKIKVNDKTESKEAQELFFELGYYWATGLKVKNLDAKFLYAKNNKITMGYCSDYFSDSDCCELTIPKLRDLVADKQDLISGADALRALADGKDVEFDTGVGTWHLVHNGLTLHCFDSCKFRLKPRTIKLVLEIPAPFEPKDNENFYVIDCDSKDGY